MWIFIELEIKGHRERQTIASYLKHPAVSNNKADNSVSSSSYGLGSAALRVFRNDCICSCSRSSDTQKHHLLPENVCPLSLSHRLRPGRHNIDSISIIITASWTQCSIIGWPGLALQVFTPRAPLVTFFMFKLFYSFFFNMYFNEGDNLYWFKSKHVE